jgi:DNA polymerase-3 subunit gamma/tau
MSYAHIALYRKYRPQYFTDVVGQSNAVEVLTKTISQKTPSHAYLFCGGRGTGKTTVARIFARDIGCNPEDIIEIDAASNRGIDEIRELRDAVRTAPFSSLYKVYIIDEAHMLTKEASNALLKTLEEPPKHVIFILATTDPQKLPDTIVSRCQKIIFNSPTVETLALRIQHVAKQEGVTLARDVADLIAKHGKGSYRDALGVLEQILTLSHKEYTYDTVSQFLGEPEEQLLMQLLASMGKKDVDAVVSIFEKISSQGEALRTYDSLIEIVRQALLGRLGKTEGIKKEIIDLGKQFPLFINSALILILLEKRTIIEISSLHAWTAFTAIVLSTISE